MGGPGKEEEGRAAGAARRAGGLLSGEAGR